MSIRAPGCIAQLKASLALQATQPYAACSATHALRRAAPPRWRRCSAPTKADRKWRPIDWEAEIRERVAEERAEAGLSEDENSMEEGGDYRLLGWL